jgi:hypothetical protein
VEQYCSCGTKLVEDALFCHKCGKPTREFVMEPDEPEPEAEAAEAPAIPLRADAAEAEAEAPPRVAAAAAAVPAGPEIHLRNSLTVRVTMMGAAFQLLAGALLGVGGPVLSQAAPLLAGGFACYLFMKRGGFRLSVIEGARLGWLTGLMCFVVAVVLITIVMTAVSSESFMETVRQSGSGGVQGDALKALERLQSEPSALFLVLPYQFLMLTLLASIGGALGAKLLSRD